ncbi:LIM/homeobox protein Awh-like [Ruditapes philippinarum]|uniref:LIM/homeobox protein Awh-like n=1 Tax=Ruditapes philippinarum TaxID=129788 RepID=UPI00295B12E3|nr:LIM/homeobox protein Awh-like [Ruditapes philippinarum]
MDFRSISSFVNSPGSDSLQTNPSSPLDQFRSTTGSGPVKIQTKPICEGCRKVIHDRWLLRVGDSMYHMSCLRCCLCLRTLDSHTSCFVRDEQVYCKYHYQSRFCPKCVGCNEPLLPSDWVRTARDFIYHLDCFCCHVCKRKLTTGDACAVRPEGVMCLDHCDGPSTPDDDNISVSSVDSDYRGSETDERGLSGKRPRTTFTQVQTKLLQDNFRRNPNPSPEEMERIADMTGHPRKTVMIWFQNARARNKKLLLSGSITSANQSKKAGTCHWIANPCSPGTIPFSE